jgi:hypothetical protein
VVFVCPFQFQPFDRWNRMIDDRFNEGRLHVLLYINVCVILLQQPF